MKFNLSPVEKIIFYLYAYLQHDDIIEIINLYKWGNFDEL